MSSHFFACFPILFLARLPWRSRLVAVKQTMLYAEVDVVPENVSDLR